MSGGKNQATAGFIHYILALGVIAVIAVVVQQQVVPWAVSSFVNYQFQPTGDEREKIGYVEFTGETLTWASTSKDKEVELNGISDPKIEKKWINGEFIFDFSSEERNSKQHGYVKGSAEFYIKAPKLGEEALILEPYVAFTIISIVIGFVAMLLITSFFPVQLGLTSVIFAEQIHHVKTKVRLQTGFSDEIVDILTLPGSQLEQIDRERVENAFRIIWGKSVTEAEKTSDYKIGFDDVWDEDTDVVFFRDNAIYQRIREYFSEFVEVEIVNTKSARSWLRNRLHFFKGLRLYMAQHFSHHYSNTVTGLAYAGAAILIIAVGIRGLKLIPAAKPSLIMGAIFLEFSLLSLMAVTLLYTQEEERTDKMLKRMEDANRSQLEAIKGQSEDIHQLANALVGQSSDIVRRKVEDTISEYLTSGQQVEEQMGKILAKEIIKKLT